MNITEIFIKGRKVSIKKRNSECIEVHSWIIIEKDEFIKLKKLSSERVLYNIESSDDIEMEIVSPAGVFGFQSKVREVISEGEIIAEIPIKISSMRKRAFKRAEVKCAAEIMYNNNISKGIIMDISEGGAYIAANVDIKAGELLKIDTVIDNKERITVEGKIKRKEKFCHGKLIKRYGFGVEFLELDQEKAELIRNYIYNILKK